SPELAPATSPNWTTVRRQRSARPTRPAADWLSIRRRVHAGSPATIGAPAAADPARQRGATRPTASHCTNSPGYWAPLPARRTSRPAPAHGPGWARRGPVAERPIHQKTGPARRHGRCRVGQAVRGPAPRIWASSAPASEQQLLRCPARPPRYTRTPEDAAETASTRLTTSPSR